MDYDIDYGDMSGLDFGDIDLSGLDLGDLDLGGLDLGDIDLSGLEGLDLSGIDLGSLENMDIGGMDLGGLEGMDFGGGGDGVIVGGPIGNGSQQEGLSFADSLDDMDLRMGDANGYESNFDNIDSIMNNAGRGVSDSSETQSSSGNKDSFGPGWQQVGNDRVFIDYEDGTGYGINENGEPYALTKEEVDQMVKNKQINTYESGYNTATGGNKIAPGGGTPVTLKNGKEGYLMSSGKVIDVKTGNQIGTNKDVKTETSGTKPGGSTSGTKPGSSSGSGSGSGSNTGKSNDLKFLLPLLLAMMAMNRGGGGGGSSAVIPSLSADRKQLPYGPSSGTPSARPGAGGTTYFSPTTYTKKAAGGGMMYGGGGISSLGGYSDGGRLLRGPGDGVSDSIPATIGGKQPARLATGEFVVPARIVSELGNGSTEAGAKKLYAMMDRVQKARRKTKNVAADTKAHKYLPA